MDFFEKFGERQSAKVRQAQFHFLAGLGLRGLKKETEAEAEFKTARELNPNQWEIWRRMAEADKLR
jgi:hypothetical protein